MSRPTSTPGSSPTSGAPTNPAARPGGEPWSAETWQLLGAVLVVAGTGVLILAHDHTISRQALLAVGGYVGAAAALLVAAGRRRATDRWASLLVAVALFVLATAAGTG
ncbi:hypothetical protein [Patulibacter minatonensis]|uniref:hypothetical protein n=1 Tax=Patulibacter minatonensis TaxID=298163 RepID=UPI00047A2114|nr:hypothetical protein [Patulibacter minatonensis]